ncbi:hypothetical protein D3C80_850520 [compost metagenome]
MQLVKGMSHQRRTAAQRQPTRPAGQLVVTDQIAEGASLPGFARLIAVFITQPTSSHQHIAHAQHQHRQAYRRHAEEAKTADAFAYQLAVYHHVRRGRHQGHHAADQAGKAQRHHQPSRGDFHSRRHAEHYRDKNCHHAGRAHECPQAGDCDHQQHQHFGFATAGDLHQPVSHLISHPGTHQPFTNHEQRSNQDHVGVAEPDRGLRQGQGTAQHKGDDHQQRHYVHTQFIGGKQHNGNQQ